VANQLVEIADDQGNLVGKSGVESALSYQDLNAMINLWGEDQKLQLEKDKLAVRKYFLEHVNQNTVFFHSLKERKVRRRAHLRTWVFWVPRGEEERKARVLHTE